MDSARWNKLQTSPEKLLAAAEEYRLRAYAPYSNFLVGAAMLMSDGSVFGGCNVEISSYGLTICAERVAMTSAIVNGSANPLAVAVVGGGKIFCPPCGGCRQFLCEFNHEMEIITWRNGEIYIAPLAELLPDRFHLANNITDFEMKDR